MVWAIDLVLRLVFTRTFIIVIFCLRCYHRRIPLIRHLAIEEAMTTSAKLQQEVVVMVSHLQLMFYQWYFIAPADEVYLTVVVMITELAFRVTQTVLIPGQICLSIMVVWQMDSIVTLNLQTQLSMNRPSCSVKLLVEALAWLMIDSLISPVFTLNFLTFQKWSLVLKVTQVLKLSMVLIKSLLARATTLLTHQRQEVISFGVLNYQRFGVRVASATVWFV